MSDSTNSTQIPQPIQVISESWTAQSEKGTALGIHLLLMSYRLLGRRGIRLILRLVSFYYVIFAKKARLASLQYLAKVSLPSSFWQVWTHIYTFAQCTFDRVLFARGELSKFEIRRHGTHYLDRLHQQGRGAILLGAHLGSFEAMQAATTFHNFPIYMLTYEANAKRIQAFLKHVGNDIHRPIIEINPGNPGYIFQIRDLIEQGALIAILGDRVGLNEKTASVEFFADQAHFPTGPYTLAALLQCPIYLTFGLYRGKNRYDLYCEPFAETLHLPRHKRAENLALHAQNYAKRLEFFCQTAPYNWFNFFNFWSSP